EAPDLVFLDIKMPGMDGLEVLQKLRHLVEVTPIVVISGHADITTAVEATRLGAFDFIRKPVGGPPIVVISGHADITTAVEATRLGAFDFIEKPLERERVLVTVRNAVDT